MAWKCVLVVEDDADIRDTLRELLNLEGYQTLTASNGKEGLDLLRKVDHPCLILLDLMMPIMNGWEFLEAIEEGKGDTLTTIPIVIVSAAGDAARNVKDKAAGFIKKPVDLDRLIQTVNRYCQATSDEQAA
jgi:CheY-like chemotaxis protein